MNQLLKMVMDGGNRDWFETQVGRGYDESKFRLAQEPDDFHKICCECGEQIEGDVCVKCHNPANCPNYPEDCAVCDRYVDLVMEMREAGI